MLLLAGLALSACGKVGEPVPPAPEARFRTVLRMATQQGSTIHLIWDRPNTEALRQEGFRLRRFEIYRAPGGPGAPDPGDAEFLEKSRLVGIVNEETVRESAAGTHLEFVDLPENGPGQRFRYAVRMVSQNGRLGAVSNVIAVYLDPAAARPPAELVTTDQEQDAVLLRWLPPRATIDGATSPHVIGYTIYRRETGKVNGWIKLSGPNPVPGQSFIDREFVYGTPYQYTVRAVAVARDGRVIESEDGKAVEHQARDVFPPVAPEGLTAGSANVVISLFWAPGGDPDLAGYFIYRAVRAEGPPDWARLNAAPHTLTTFRDERTERGTVYLYRVTAVDRSGNESRPSDVVAQEAN